MLCQNGHKLLIDFSSKVVKNQNALQFIDSYGDNTDYLENDIVGQVVVDSYANAKTYRIDGIDWNLSPLSTFQLKTGEQVSYVQYYKQKYNLTIKDKGQPLLIHNDRLSGRVNLVPELMFMCGITDQEKYAYCIFGGFLYRGGGGEILFFFWVTDIQNILIPFIFINQEKLPADEGDSDSHEALSGGAAL